MKYYIVVTPFFPTEKSFRGPFIYDQVQAIKRNSEYQVVVFKPTNVINPEEDYIYEGVKVHTFKDYHMPSNIFNGLTSPLATISFRKKLKSIGISIDDIAVVHGHTALFASYPVSLKKSNPNIKTILQFHDPDPFAIRIGKFSKYRINTLFKILNEKRLFEKIDILVGVSKYVANNLLTFPEVQPYEKYQQYIDALKLARGITPIKTKKSIVLYNGVDTSKFFPAPVEHSTFNIGCIANFNDWKNQLMLIKSLKEVIDTGFDNLHLYLIGSGPTKHECENYVKMNNLHDFITFSDEVHHKELNLFYNILDLFVLPSYFEGFGCVFSEAYACGVPFVCCRNQGASELIDDETLDLWTVEKDDIASLTEIIIRQIKKPLIQRLKTTIDINKLVKDFLLEI